MIGKEDGRGMRIGKRKGEEGWNRREEEKRRGRGEGRDEEEREERMGGGEEYWEEGEKRRGILGRGNRRRGKEEQKSIV